MKTVYWVPHTHWDREWYRSFQSFRAYLVDAIDVVLDKLQTEPEYKFLLDGQTVVLEDYLEIRPQRETDIRTAVEAGRLAIGPWYVQPDSLIPGGEAHIRNLLLGRAVGREFGEVSRIAYTPDSFGHPAQFPQLFRGFDMRAFVYWRGNGNELDELPAEYRWQSPDGSEITACLMYKGYFNGAMLPSKVEHAVVVLKIAYMEVAEQTEQDSVLIMNGIDHAPPNPNAIPMARSLQDTLQTEVRVSLLEEFVDSIKGELPAYSGSLIGGKIANLLPGVWSTRMPLKLANRRAETTLQSVTEPLAALAPLFGLRDERASLETAWKALLKNQAHDSIGGCSIDRVHTQMQPRYFAAQSLADETARRLMERLAGQHPSRQTPMGQPMEVAIFNPTPYPRSGVARLQLDATPALASVDEGSVFHPVLLANKGQEGYTANGKPVRTVPGSSDGRFFFDEHQHALDLEIPIDDVPAYGYKRVVLHTTEPSDDTRDEGRRIANQHLAVELAEDGTISFCAGSRTWGALFGVEDLADRGDSYDADILPDGGRCQLLRCKHQRIQHINGTQILRVERLYRIPRELNEDRTARGEEETGVRLFTDFQLYPGSDELKVQIRLKNTAKDHRFRLLFPTANTVDSYSYATTLDVASGTTVQADASAWIHPAPTSFIHQGWVAVDGLTVVAPGLPEAEVTSDGCLAITLLRSVGWLSRPDLESRPGPAGPVIPADEAQCLETIEAEMTLFTGISGIKAQHTEVPLSAVFAGPAPLLRDNQSMLRLESDTLQLSAFKPAQQGGDIIIRLLNPSNEHVKGALHSGFDILNAQIVTLDEERRDDCFLHFSTRLIEVALSPHQLQTIRVTAKTNL